MEGFFSQDFKDVDGNSPILNHLSTGAITSLSDATALSPWRVYQWITHV